MISLMSLVPFMADRSEGTFEAAAKTILTSGADEEQIHILENILGVFGARFFGEETVRAIYGRLFMSNNSLADLYLTSPLTQSWLADAKLEGMRELLRLSLEQKFGTLTSEIVDALNQADRTTLIGIQMQLPTLSLADLHARLLPQNPDTTNQP